MSNIKLNHIYGPSGKDIGANAFDFLCQLGGPSVIHINGADNSRCRVITTLLHGNEPSGLKAVHNFIQQGIIPATAVKIIIASVIAARTEPVFSHRMLPGQRDLNRCFTDSVFDLQGQLAQAISEQINDFSPEAVIDLHNTSGSGPAFCVSTKEKTEHIALTSHFTRKLIHTDIRLGSIMEQDFGCPIVTVEAGGAQDIEADNNAFCGIQSFLTCKNVFEPRAEIEVLRRPRRLEIKATSTLTFANEINDDFDITICQDIEKLNFGLTQSSQQIGWLKQDMLNHLQLDIDTQPLAKFFRIEDGALLTNQPLKLFMVTTRADIAKSDCLFYFVEKDS